MDKGLPKKRMANKWQQIKKLASEEGAKPWDFLNASTEYVAEEEASKRYETCLACPLLNKITKTCQECGCFMAAKTKLKLATCPIGKW